VVSPSDPVTVKPATARARARHTRHRYRIKKLGRVVGTGDSGGARVRGGGMRTFSLDLRRPWLLTWRKGGLKTGSRGRFDLRTATDVVAGGRAVGGFGGPGAAAQAGYPHHASHGVGHHGGFGQPQGASGVLGGGSQRPELQVMSPMGAHQAHLRA